MNCKWKSKYIIDETSICNREAHDSSGYCIFHKPNKTIEESILFNEKLKRNSYDFKGFVFAEEFNFSNLNKDKSYSIDLEEKIDFSEAIFYKKASFDDCEFIADVYFYYTKFKGGVSFKNALFREDCIFIKNKFEVKGVRPFYKAKFIGQNILFEDINEGPNFDGIRFSQNTRFTLENVRYSKNQYSDGKVAYRIAKNQANIIGDYDKVGAYYYNERWYNGKEIFPPISFWNKKKKGLEKIELFTSIKEKKHYRYIVPKIIDLSSKHIVGYGEKPKNVLFLSFILISIFACLYMFTGLRFDICTEKGTSEKIIKYTWCLNLEDISLKELKLFLKDYFQFWYFSIVTFTTVGYGDVIPINTLGKILSAIEMFLGVTMVAAWTSILVRKMSR